MKRIWGSRTDSETVAVITTADASQGFVKKLTDELKGLKVDSIVIEDNTPEFVFSRSMNTGIKEALEHDYKFIIASNDDIENIIGLEEIITCLKKDDRGYASPYINGVSPSQLVTQSPLQMLARFSLIQKAPIFAYKRLRFLKRILGKDFVSPVPAFSFDKNKYVNSQPFCVFNSEVLRKEMFDENFVPIGMEDTELSFRLMLHGFHGYTNNRWNVTHFNTRTFKTGYKQKRDWYVDFWNDKEERIKSTYQYFIAKHRDQFS